MAKANRVWPRERTGHSKHPLPTTQEKTLHILCHATLAHYAASTGLLSAPPTRLFFAHATFTAFHSAPVMSQQKRLSPFLISHPIPRFLYDCSPFLPHYSISSSKAGLAHLHALCSLLSFRGALSGQQWQDQRPAAFVPEVVRSFLLPAPWQTWLQTF